MSTESLFEEIGRSCEARFRAESTILSFDQYLQELAARPYGLTRDAAQYAADMMEWFGTTEVPGIGGTVTRFNLFDDRHGSGFAKVVGQEEVQREIHSALLEFVQRQQIDKLVLLHGPNGSAKTSLVAAFVRGLETYSRTEEGALYTFNWIFSEGAERGERLGFDPVRPEEEMDSFAFLEASRISARIPSELAENPVFLIPRENRCRILESALEDAPESEKERFVRTRFLLEGDLSPKSRRIHDCLMTAYRGEWRKVVRHIQVQRYTISRRFRRGAVTIEPQGNVDAGTRQIGHATMQGLPAVLQNENIVEAFGDLVDANGGIVEYSDFFKRSMEVNKYLLTTAENGVISLPQYTAYLNVLLVATSNESYLSAFRRDPLFSSFKARLELIRVPYLLQAGKEAEIYERHLAKLPADVHLSPRASRIAALWAVMTRLMPPKAEVDDSRLRRVLERLTPLEKALLYDDGTTPSHLDEDERNLLRGYVRELKAEYDNHEEEFEGMWDAAYEGRRGCSPREMLTLFSDVAHAAPGRCISALLVLRNLGQLTKDPSLHEFLRLKRTKQGYHDCDEFEEELRLHLLKELRDDIQRASELVEESEYQRLFLRYFMNVKAHGTKEKVLDESSGRYVEPDEEFMGRIEQLIGIDDEAEAFRSALMTRVAAFRLEHPERPLVYEELFANEFRSLHENFFREKMDRVVQLVEDALIIEGARPGAVDDERRAAAERFCERMRSERDYCNQCLIESLQFFLDNAYELD